MSTALCAGCARVSSGGGGGADARAGDLSPDGPPADAPSVDGLAPDALRLDGSRPDLPRPDASWVDGLVVDAPAPDAPRDTSADLPEPTRYDERGSGTQADPYLLKNAAQWLDLAATPYAWELHFRLIEDIDLEPTVGDHPPIGTLETSFTGVVDGGEHVISNFRNTSGSTNNGLFGYVDGPTARIENIAVEDADVEGAEPTGALVGLLVRGEVRNAAAFGDDCYVRSASYANHKGGLIGRVNQDGVVRDVFSTCRVGGTGIGIAGLIGHNEGVLTNGYYVNTSYPITGANRTAGQHLHRRRCRGQHLAVPCGAAHRHLSGRGDELLFRQHAQREQQRHRRHHGKRHRHRHRRPARLLFQQEQSPAEQLGFHHHLDPADRRLPGAPLARQPLSVESLPEP
jgi:hypothetical protein